jgi:autotransporter-associated beta strand protein
MKDGSKMSPEGGSLTIAYIPDMYGTRANPTVFDIYTNASFNSHNFGFNVSRGSAGLGTVNVRGGSLVTSNGTLQVVNAKTPPSAITTGLVNLVDGLIYAKYVNVGLTSNSVAILHQTGGSLQVPADLYMGKDTNALGLFVQEGGLAYCGQFYLGGAAGGTGEIDLVGGTLIAANNVTAIGKAANACGRLLQTGGSLVCSNSISVGVGAGSFGVYTNTGGSLWLNGTLYLGNGAGSFGRGYFSGSSNWISTGVTVGSASFSTGELVVTGGSLIMPNNALTVGNQTGSVGRVVISGGQNFFKGMMIGNSGVGDLTITGGTLVLTNAGSWMVGNTTGSVGTVTISGGTNYFQGQGSTFGQYGYGRLRIEGGYSYTTNRLVVGGGGSGTGRLELVGGVLSVPIIDGRDPTLATNPGGYSEVLFDGGTLQHSVDGEWWMPGGFVSTFAKATLTDRGAVIDSNGGVLTITQALSNEVGYAGSFTKKGAGSLTLTSWYNAFTGRVAVQQGELAVSSAGAIYLTGGVAIDAGAILNLASAGTIRDLTTSAGTVSRIDGALNLKSGVVLTNGVGATLGGGGVVTGNVVFASGSVCGRDKTTVAGTLRVTGNAVFQNGVTVALTGYTAQELEAGLPMVTAGTLQVTGKIPVTLNNASHPYWWATVSSDGKTLTAHVIRSGTLISVR